MKLHVIDKPHTILSLVIILIFALLGGTCIHWGLTVKDTASGTSLLVGLILIIFAIKLAVLVWRRNIIFGRVEKE